METLKQITATVFSIAKQEVFQIIGDIRMMLKLFWLMFYLIESSLEQVCHSIKACVG